MAIRILAAVALATTLLAAPGFAQQAKGTAADAAPRPMGAARHGVPFALSNTDDFRVLAGRSAPSSLGFSEATAKMRNVMSIEPTGDADRDYVKLMIPHHQGAIDMAKVLLAHGKDPDLKRAAEKVIAGRTEEISALRQWLKEHPEPQVQSRR